MSEFRLSLVKPLGGPIFQKTIICINKLQLLFNSKLSVGELFDWAVWESGDRVVKLVVPKNYLDKSNLYMGQMNGFAMNPKQRLGRAKFIDKKTELTKSSMILLFSCWRPRVPALISSHDERIIHHPVIFSHPDLGRVVCPNDLVDHEDEVQVGDEEQVNEEPVALKVFLKHWPKQWIVGCLPLALGNILIHFWRGRFSRQV